MTTGIIETLLVIVFLAWLCWKIVTATLKAGIRGTSRAWHDPINRRSATPCPAHNPYTGHRCTSYQGHGGMHYVMGSAERWGDVDAR